VQGVQELEGDGKETLEQKIWYSVGDGYVLMFQVSCESQNTNGEDRMTSDIDRAISRPDHPIWKIILLCVLILGGGSIAADMDIIGVAGL